MFWKTHLNTVKVFCLSLVGVRTYIRRYVDGLGLATNSIAIDACFDHVLMMGYRQQPEDIILSCRSFEFGAEIAANTLNMYGTNQNKVPVPYL